MELPHPESYPRRNQYDYVADGHVEICAYCQRPSYEIAGNVDKHIMGCHFRSRWHAIRYWIHEQQLKGSFDKVNMALKKLDGE